MWRYFLLTNEGFPCVPYFRHPWPPDINDEQAPKDYLLLISLSGALGLQFI